MGTRLRPAKAFGKVDIRFEPVRSSVSAIGAALIAIA
jgi:hypothetical protein